MSNVARVGAIMVVGLLLLGGVFFFLSDRFWRARSYTVTVVFDNAMGLAKGAKVRMAGVDVGVVGGVSLTPDNRARIPLLIDKERLIPEGSAFTIASGALIGEKYVDIAPAPSSKAIDPESVIEGPQVKKPFQIEEVGSEVSKLIGDFQKISANLNAVMGNPNLQRDLVSAVAHLAAATARAEEMMAGTNAVVARNQAQVDRTMQNLVDASQELHAAVSDVRGLVNNPQIEANVVQTSEALRTASERLDAVLQDVREVTADPEVATNLKQTALNLSEATAYARDVTQRVDRFLGSGGPKISINLPKPEFQSGTRLILESAGSGAGNVRTDLTLTVPTGKDAGLRLGLYDFTESNRLIAQRIQWLDPRTATRYGLFGGSLGLGVDHTLSARLNVTADLYDPKYPRLDVRGHYSYTDDLGVVFGLDSILRAPRAVVGLQWRQ